MGSGVLQRESILKERQSREYCCQGCHADTSATGSLMWGKNQLEFCQCCSDELPFCHTCEAPAGSLADLGGRSLCCRCFTPLVSCHVCGNEGFRDVSTYETLCFCEDCSDVLVGNCRLCAQLDVLVDDFHCAACKDSGVTDEKRARELADEVITFMEESMGMIVSKEIGFRLVARVDSPEGTTYQGIFRGDLDQVEVISGLPEPLFLSIFAHEWAHAWQSEHCPRQEMDLLEGFASWVEFKILYELYEDFAKTSLENSTLEHYGPGLRTCLRLEQHFGERGLIQAVRRWTGFPLGA